jgi:hypothetical protein
MNSEQDLINKLMISKKIMEKHNTMGRGNATETMVNTAPMVESHQPVNANYNLPPDLMLNENKTQMPQLPTEDRIMNSKLPDEIKRLMMEHPIEQPGIGNGPTLSNELVEKASRLMGTNPKPINEESKTINRTVQQSSPSIDKNDLRDIIRETVEDVLKENGLLVESTTRSDEVFKFRVGNHIFEGKLTKIKKIQK